MGQYSDEYWKKRLPEDLPEKHRQAIIRIYSAYPTGHGYMPQGLSDPMYILNILAFEIGFGDGKGKFYDLSEVINDTD